MNRVMAFIYGALTYVLFLGTFLYMIGFVGNLVVPKSIDSGPPAPVALAILINSVLLALFAVQHAVMARPGFKVWWTRYVPKPVERSTFVLATCALLVLMVWLWRPMTATIWQVDAPWGRALLIGLSLFGWALALYSSFLIDHFDLFGLRQVWLHLRGERYWHRPFVERSIYKWTRHPLMLGFMIAFWATPDMTAGHLLFAILTTAYVFVGTRLEEADLVRLLGEDYIRYRERTSMFLPLPRRRQTAPAVKTCQS